MRPVSHSVVGLFALFLSACELKLKQAKTPPPPQPTVAKAEPSPPPAPVEPLSIPQTQVRLPQPQPIVPEAIATPPTPPVETAARPKVRKRNAGPQPPTASPAKPEPVETAEAPPATEPPPRRVEPVLPEEQRRQLLEEISARLKEVDQTLGRVTARNLNDAQKGIVNEIKTFTAQAYQAKDQGDIQKAVGLADRALILAQGLDRGR